MKILITYDVDTNQPAMKKALQKRGYTDVMWFGAHSVNLANTTLWHAENTVEQGLKDLQECAAEAKCKLLRGTSIGISGAMGITGQPHTT